MAIEFEDKHSFWRSKGSLAYPPSRSLGNFGDEMNSWIAGPADFSGVSGAGEDEEEWTINSDGLGADFPLQQQTLHL